MTLSRRNTNILNTQKSILLLYRLIIFFCFETSNSLYLSNGTWATLFACLPSVWRDASLVFSTCHHLLIAIGKTRTEVPNFDLYLLAGKMKKDMKLARRL